MSVKLDQSLDEILSSRRQTARRGGRGGRRAANSDRASAVAPVGGVKKTTRTTRGSARAVVPSGPASGTGDSKIIVSNLVCGVNLLLIKIPLTICPSLPTSTRFRSRYVELEATVFLDFPRQLLHGRRYC